MVIKPLAALYVQVNDLSRSVAFYTKVLGTPFEQKSPKIAISTLGDLTVVLQESKRTALTTAVSFAVNDLDETANVVMRAGGNVNRGRTEGIMGPVVNLTDPDGNPLEFVQLTDNASDLPEVHQP